jgi:ubiquinone/menaquinone biosynthesis C-methylase UbiE
VGSPNKADCWPAAAFWRAVAVRRVITPTTRTRGPARTIHVRAAHPVTRPQSRAATVRQVNEQEVLERTRRDYDQVADLYDDMVRKSDAVIDALPTAMITAFANIIRASGSAGDVLDAGCGPGQWTDHLDRAGIRVYGIDLSPAMVAIARRYRPDLRYEVGSMLQLEARDGAVAGVLAHFSLIHTPPKLLPSVLAEFARVIEPGGPLLIGAQITDTAEADGWVPYDHRASPAYLWTLDALADQLRKHDFTEIGRLRLVPPAPGKPPGGYLLTTRDRRDN